MTRLLGTVLSCLVAWNCGQPAAADLETDESTAGDALSPGATLVVDDDGAQCPKARFQTIQSAVDAAQAGDTIRVCAGTYAENVVVDKTLRLRGAQAGHDARKRHVGLDRESVVTGGAPFFLRADDVVLDGFYVLEQSVGNGNEPEEEPGVSTWAGNSGYLIQNTIFDAATTGLFARSSGVRTSVVRRNRFQGHLGLGSGENDGEGQARNLRVEKNLFRGAGVALSGVGDQDLVFTANTFQETGASLRNVAQVQLVRNTFLHPTSPAISVASARDVLLRDNRLKDGSHTGILVGVSTQDVRVEKNRLAGFAGPAIWLAGDPPSQPSSGSTVEHNEVEDGAQGILLSFASGNSVVDNNVEDNSGVGIDVAADCRGNLLRGNEARGNGGWDCRDAAPTGANFWDFNEGSHSDPRVLCTDRPHHADGGLPDAGGADAGAQCTSVLDCPVLPCQTAFLCTAGQCQYALDTDGTACGTPGVQGVCVGGQCQTQVCVVPSDGGTVVLQPGQSLPGSGCLWCDPSQSRTQRVPVTCPESANPCALSVCTNTATCSGTACCTEQFLPPGTACTTAEGTGTCSTAGVCELPQTTRVTHALAVIADFADRRLEDWTGAGFRSEADVRSMLDAMSAHWLALSLGTHRMDWSITRVQLPQDLTPTAFPGWPDYRLAVINLARQQINPDDFDADGDSVLDVVWIIASNGDVDAPYLVGGAARVDAANTFVDGQASQSVRSGAIGNFNHEAGHNLGLPDLYGPYGTIVYLSVMADSWPVPPNLFSAFDKIKLQYFQPTVVTHSTTGVEVQVAEAAFSAVKVPTLRPYEYFLIEHRKQPTSGYGSAAGPAYDGLAIYHVLEISNQGTNPPLLKLEPADGSIVPDTAPAVTDFWFPENAAMQLPYVARTYFSDAPLFTLDNLQRTPGGMRFDLQVFPEDPAHLPNLLTNGTYEDGSGGTPTAWSPDAFQSGATFRWETSPVHSGARSVSVSAPVGAPNDARWIQSVNGLTPDAPYVLCGWLKGQDIVDQQGGGLGGNLSVLGGFTSTGDGLGSFDWRQECVAFPAPAASVTVACRLGLYGSVASGTVFCDDVTLSPLQRAFP